MAKLVDPSGTTFGRSVRNMLTCENLSVPSQLLAAVLFGFVSILATYTGIETGGAIVNTRVIGVLSAGLLGGPVIGIGAALIGGIHRYFYEAGQLTAAACAVSTMAEAVRERRLQKRQQRKTNRTENVR